MHIIAQCNHTQTMEVCFRVLLAHCQQLVQLYMVAQNRDCCTTAGILSNHILIVKGDWPSYSLFDAFPGCLPNANKNKDNYLMIANIYLYLRKGATFVYYYIPLPVSRSSLARGQLNFFQYCSTSRWANQIAAKPRPDSVYFSL